MEPQKLGAHAGWMPYVGWQAFRLLEGHSRFPAFVSVHLCLRSQPLRTCSTLQEQQHKQHRTVAPRKLQDITRERRAKAPPRWRSKPRDQEALNGRGPSPESAGQGSNSHIRGSQPFKASRRVSAVIQHGIHVAQKSKLYSAGASLRSKCQQWRGTLAIPPLCCFSFNHSRTPTSVLMFVLFLFVPFGFVLLVVFVLF